MNVNTASHCHPISIGTAAGNMPEACRQLISGKFSMNLLCKLSGQSVFRTCIFGHSFEKFSVFLSSIISSPWKLTARCRAYVSLECIHLFSHVILPFQKLLKADFHILIEALFIMFSIFTCQ